MGVQNAEHGNAPESVFRVETNGEAIGVRLVIAVIRPIGTLTAMTKD